MSNANEDGNPQMMSRTERDRNRDRDLSLDFDLGQAKAIAERLQILADASRIFAEAGASYQSVVETVVKVVATHMQSMCNLRLLSDDGQALELISFHDPDEKVAAILWPVFARNPINVDSRLPAAMAFRTGQAFLTYPLDLDDMRRGLPTELQDTVQFLQHASAISVPLRAQGKLIGVLGVVRHQPNLPPLNQQDLTLLQDLSDRAAMAISTARLLAHTENELAIRQRAEREVALQAKLLQHINDAVIAVDASIKIISWNLGAEAIYGYHAFEVLGKPSIDVLKTEYADASREMVLAELRTSGVWRGEVRQVRKDGKVIYIMSTVTLVSDKALMAGGMVAVNKDITERKLTEARVKFLSDASHAFAMVGSDYQTLLQQITEIIAVGMRCGVVIRLLSDDGQRLIDVVACDSHPTHGETIASVAMQQQSIALDSGHISTQSINTGNTVFYSTVDPVHYRGMLTPDEQLVFDRHPVHSYIGAPLQVADRIIGNLSLYRNRADEEPFIETDRELAQDLANRAALSISNAKLLQQVQHELAERKRAESHIRFQANLLRNINDAVIATDLSFKITSWSPAAETLYGWTAAEAIGHSATELLPTQYQGIQRSDMLESLNVHGFWSGEALQKRKDQSSLYVIASLSCVHDASGQVVGYVTVNHNVTERKRAENRLKLLADVSKAFAEAGSDFNHVLRTVVRVVANAIHGGCALRLLSKDEQRLETVTMHDIDSTASELLYEIYGKNATQVSGPELGAVAFRTGQAMLLPTQTLRQLRPSINPIYWPVLDQLPYISSILVPLQAYGKSIGLLALTRHSAAVPEFDQWDLLVAQDLADYAALAIDNSGLLQKLQYELAERRAAEAQIAFQAKLLQNITDAIVVTDLEQNIISWNRAAEKLYGWTEQEVLGQHGSLVFGSKFGEPEVRQFLSELRERGAWQGDELQHHKDGHELHVTTSLAPVLDDNGDVTGYIALQHDITDRVHAENRTKILAAVAHALVQNRPDETEIATVVATALVQHLGDSCSVHIMSEGRRVLKQVAFFDRDAAICEQGQQFRLNVPIDSAAPVAQVFRTGMARSSHQMQLAQELAVLEGDILKFTQLIAPRSGIFAPLLVQNESFGVIVLSRRESNWPLFVAEDVTLLQDIANRTALAIMNARLFAQAHQELLERKQAEAALETERALLARRVEERTADLSLANVELARAARLKDEFLASMSHELRTPLNSVLGRSEAMLEGIYGPLSVKQIESLQGIEESGRHLLALINDILDLSKIESGNLTLEYDTVAVDLLCAMSLRMVTQTAVQKQIKISSSIDSAVEIVWGDERRLKQILVNLLSNAVKFTPTGGKVGIEVTGNMDDHTVTFTVWDTGIGIADEDMPRLFKPFVQIDSSLTRQYSGTGLGLSLVMRLAEAHHGSVSLKSTLGEGSQFSVTLPWQPNRDVAKILPPLESAVVHTARPDLRQVLVIEDSPTTATQLVRYLTELGVRVEHHSRGARALELTIQLRPDAVLLDILLPDQSGWDILRALKAHVATRHIPVVVISVVNEPAQAHALGAAALLVKPVNRDALVETLRHVAALHVQAATPHVFVSESETTRPRLLLAEDNQANIDVIQDYLMSKGFEVVVARNGSEAVLRVQESAPNVIIMDIQMPVMDGLEATRQLRTMETMRHVPIIAVTALVMPGDRERCLAAGANEYMAKPVQLQQLWNTLQRLLPTLG